VLEAEAGTAGRVDFDDTRQAHALTPGRFHLIEAFSAHNGRTARVIQRGSATSAASGNG
jgi:hypothetical protein